MTSIENDEDEDLRRALELSLEEQEQPALAVISKTSDSNHGTESTSRPQESDRSEPSSKAKRSRTVTAPYRLPEAEREKLFQHVFGTKIGSTPDSVLNEEDLKRWELSFFSFSDKVRFGLWQQQGGPCGVLAPLQALMRNRQQRKKKDEHCEPLEKGLMLRLLLFPRNSSEGEAHPCPPNEISDEKRWNVLIQALTITISRTTSDNIYYCVRGDKNEEMVHTFGSPEDVFTFYSGAGRESLSRAGSVVHFVYSLLLTRSLEKVLDDGDDDQQSLIGRFGHCTQELVNLALFGCATSSVFDDKQDIGGGYYVRGVTVPSVEVGYLSELEAMRLLQVGQRYKFPRYPIWVIGSQNHYTLLFCHDKKVSDAGSGNDLRQRTVREVFNRNCISVEGGMAEMTALDKICDELDIENRTELRGNLQALGSDIFLWTDFWQFLDNGSSCSVEKYTMYLYDGQDPPGPNLKHFALETCDLESAFGQGDSDNFIASLRTRWQMCLISEPTPLS